MILRHPRSTQSRSSAASDVYKRQAVHLYPDCQEHAQLVAAGTEALRASDMEKVRHIVAQLEGARIGTAADDDMVAPTNIVLG